MDPITNYDFSGWATRSNLECTDGRTIMKDAFKHCDGKKVPLIWDHQQNSPENILGCVYLQHKDEGVYAGLSVDSFRDALRDTASESVAGFDEMVEKAGSFDATLSEGWLTTDILAKTLDKLANEATGTTAGIAGLSDEQLKNVGYTEDQIQALRSLSNQAHSSTGDLATLVDNMTRKSGRELLFDSILNSCKAVQKVFATLKGAWNEVFPPATSEQLYGIIEGLNKFTEKLIISDETADKIKRTFKGLFAIISRIFKPKR